MAYLVSTPSTAPYASLVNDEAVNVPICTPVYSDGSGTFKMAIATGLATATVTGLVVDPSIAPGAPGNVLGAGMMTATTAQWDAVCGTSGGLVFGTPYYVSASTAGRLTATAPSTVGQFATLVINPVSTTKARISIQPPVGL